MVEAFVPGFEYDVFISYAWVDNQSDDEQRPELGWVSQFRERLMKRVDQKLGRIDSARVFFDTFQIRKNRDFGNQIEAALNKAAVFVSVFSPGYIASKACCEELRCFKDVVREKLSASGRLFVVHLDEVPRKKWPTTFQESFGDELLGYPFFTRTEGSNDTCPLAHDEPNFLKELNRLRCAIAQQLESMKEVGQSPGVTRMVPQSHNADLATKPSSDAVPSTKPTILLAQSPPDLRKKRQNLADYCANAGLTVLGKESDSSPAEQFAASFRENLQKTQLFVQLLSPSYSLPCEQFPQGVERWQFEQAQAAKLSILQWRDANADLSDLSEGDAHWAFLQHPDVRRDLLANFHIEVVEKAKVAQKLAAVPKTQTTKQLAILKYNDHDKDTTNELLSALKAGNITCLASNNGLALVDSVREVPARALIVVLGHCPTDWLTQRGFELLKVQLAFRDQAPLRLYYRAEDCDIVPPLNDAEVLEFRGRADLPRLIETIHALGGGL